MSSIVILRTAAAIMAVKPLLEAQIAEHGEKSFRPSEELITYMIRQSDSGAGFVLADSDIAPTGFMFINISGSITTTDTWAGVLFFYVQPEARKRKIGTALVDYARIIAAGARATRLVISAPASVEATKAAMKSEAWRKRGLVETETIFTLRV